MEKPQVSIETWKRRAAYLLRHSHLEGSFDPDDRGLWPVVQESFVHLGDGPEKVYSAEYVFSSWRPARVLAAKGYDIDPADTPALPFPFDAKALAAFMLGGMGIFVEEQYYDGALDNGLNIAALEQSIPVDELWLRTTMKEAVDAYRAARSAIGCPDGVHPDPDEIVWQLLKPDDAPAAPPTGQQDAPKRNGDGEDGRLQGGQGCQAQAEDARARQERRSQRLIQLGASFVPHGEGWRVNGPRGALAKLEREERAAGRPMSDKSDLRRDLQAAYERARQGSC